MAKKHPTSLYWSWWPRHLVTQSMEECLCSTKSPETLHKCSILPLVHKKNIKFKRENIDILQIIANFAPDFEN